MTYSTREPVDPVADPVNVNAPSARYDGPVTVAASPLAPIRRLVWLVFGVLIALIAIRFVFLALGANEGNVIVDAIYAITEPFVAPFRGIFSFETVRPIGKSVIDGASLVAIVGWALLAAVISAILRIPDRTAA
jgi:uncharacterized protein YggT (Ycf19 family)